MFIRFAKEILSMFALLVAASTIVPIIIVPLIAAGDPG
jgi:hypothetical protein